jgi:hypothetical protein
VTCEDAYIAHGLTIRYISRAKIKERECRLPPDDAMYEVMTLSVTRAHYVSNLFATVKVYKSGYFHDVAE